MGSRTWKPHEVETNGKRNGSGRRKREIGKETCVRRNGAKQHRSAGEGDRQGTNEKGGDADGKRAKNIERLAYLARQRKQGREKQQRNGEGDQRRRAKIKK